MDDWGKEEVKSSSFLEEFKSYLRSLSRNWFRTQVILEFANDWSVSMIRGFASRGYIEIAVLFRGDLDYNLNPITSDVKRYGPKDGDELKEDLRILIEFSRDFKPKLSS